MFIRLACMMRRLNTVTERGMRSDLNTTHTPTPCRHSMSLDQKCSCISSFPGLVLHFANSNDVKEKNIGLNTVNFGTYI